MKVVIDRARWDVPRNRPGSEGGGRLLNKNTGLMCCLGFIGCAVGVLGEAMRGRAMPHVVESALWPSWMLVLKDNRWGWGSSETSEKLSLLNDARDLSDSQREQAITALGATVGVEFVFEGSYLK